MPELELVPWDLGPYLVGKKVSEPCISAQLASFDDLSALVESPC